MAAKSGITLTQIYSQLAVDKNAHLKTSAAGSKLLKMKKTNQWLSANNLIRIRTMQNKGLTEDDIELLSLSGAAASKLLKGGITLTQIYSQLVASQEDLLVLKNMRQKENYERAMAAAVVSTLLKSGITLALERQREDYERAAVESLTQQLDKVERRETVETCTWPLNAV